MSAKPVWFITGCSTGFGRELAKLLLARDYRVVVTARDPMKIEDIVAPHGRTALALALDVADSRQIHAAVDAAMSRFGRIDVLVNNAGYGYMAAIEEGDEERIRALFETNVFGLAAMTRATLPILRAQGGGSIVNMSSAGGFASQPGVGYYNASKFAVEGLSEALAKEAAPLGVKVLIVEPGPFRTDFAGRSLKTPDTDLAPYANAIARRDLARARSGRQPGDPVRAAEAIIAIVEMEKPPLRLVLGALALANVRAKLDEVRADVDAHEALTLSAEYPAP